MITVHLFSCCPNIICGLAGTLQSTVRELELSLSKEKKRKGKNDKVRYYWLSTTKLELSAMLFVRANNLICMI